MNAPLQRPWRGETYHGRPALKPAGFDWKVGAYIAVLGAAGAAQVVAGMSRLRGGCDETGLARRARTFALVGSIIGPAILIGHLKTPQRWYNMLRIVRPQSPMSWGSWLLAAFGASSFASVVADRMGWRMAADLAQGPATLTGAAMATYTASLLSATSNPLWGAAPAPLAAAFGASSMASGASALALMQRRAGDAQGARQLEQLAALSLAVEFLAMRTAEARWREAGVMAPLEEGAPGMLHKGGGKALGMAVPAAAAMLGQPALASAAIIAGSALMRQAVLRAGDASATRPADYLRITQPEPVR
ncbi:MAG TPA: NrfD/PsrC family molybdoenzyme membrane anchor subunit [Acetobacteraceae bacterium]|nr:NrfD/PsrC family molybdoenzyme membrane anchor subunit [Acetobacteraceae bacterium]